MPRLRLSSYNLSQIDSDRAHEDADANTHRPDEHAVNIRHTNAPRSRYPDRSVSFSVLDSYRFTSPFPRQKIVKTRHFHRENRKSKRS